MAHVLPTKKAYLPNPVLLGTLNVMSRQSLISRLLLPLIHQQTTSRIIQPHISFAIPTQIVHLMGGWPLITNQNIPFMGGMAVATPLLPLQHTRPHRVPLDPPLAPDTLQSSNTPILVQ